MKILSKLVVQNARTVRVLLQFPISIELPRASSFKISWGAKNIAVKGVGKLSGTLFELHLEEQPAFPIFEGCKYESFPDDCLSKIKIAYEGKIRQENGEALGERLEFQVIL